MSLVKVSVENLENSERELFEIDKNQTLEDNIKNVCKLFQKPSESKAYALKLLSTNDGKIVHSYISEENFSEIRDGYFLKLVYSVSYYVQRIFEHIDDGYKSKSFDDLYNLSIDPEFIKELVRSEKHLLLINHFVKADLEGIELTAGLIAIVHLFQKGYINEIPPDFLVKIISVIKTDSDSKTPEQIKYALSIIHKILYHRDLNFNKWKEEIVKQIPITELTPYIWSEDNKDLQYAALLLINTIIKCCKGEKKLQLIKEINLKNNRESIYTHIILPGNVDKAMAHELYAYQTYLFSLYSEALNSQVNLSDDVIFQKDEFELSDDEINRISILMDFDENPVKNISIENLLGYNDNSRISLATMSSSICSTSESSNSNKTLSTSTHNLDNDDCTINYLTLEALRHYKKWHYKNFYQSQIEEKVYEPGIFVTSERIIKMLTKILHVGLEPDKNSLFYQPTVFNCSVRTPFLLELFSRTMWLLSKTRREMKASTINDYPKVLNILEKQIRLVLDEKPMNLTALTEKMLINNYATVMKYWQREKDEEIEVLLASNPNVQALKSFYISQNQELVFQQRISFLQKGAIFPKIIDKKITGQFNAKLSDNKRQLIISNWNSSRNTFVGENIIYNINHITHVVEGRACPHVKNNLVKNPSVAFSLLFENHEYLNFRAKDSKMASYWIDGFNLLLEKDNKSEFFKQELEDLVKMDLLLHLLEVQNITLPKKPPPVPPLPQDCKEKSPVSFDQY